MLVSGETAMSTAYSSTSALPFAVMGRQYLLIRADVPSVDRDCLTEAEREVACLVAKGKTNVEIAHIRRTSARTVEEQLSVVYRKLGVDCRSQLIALGVAGDESRMVRQPADRQLRVDHELAYRVLPNTGNRVQS
jgi:DNA-binding NarL/FixJ family response regulator